MNVMGLALCGLIGQSTGVRRGRAFHIEVTN
jgi:hypothetical protein